MIKGFIYGFFNFFDWFILEEVFIIYIILFIL